MPKFSGTDYYAREILFRQNRLRKYILNHGPKLFHTINFGDLKNEAYRKPWETISICNKDLAFQDSSDESLAAATESFALIHQEEPPDKLHVTDVTQGLFVENFDGSPETINPPFLSSYSLSDNDCTFNYLNLLKSATAVEVGGLSDLCHSNLGRESPCTTDAVTSSCQEFKVCLLEEPVINTQLDFVQKHSHDAKIQDIVELEKMRSSFSENDCREVQEVAYSIKKKSARTEQCMEHPIADQSIGYIQDSRFVDELCNFADVVEEPLDMSEWDLNLIEPCPLPYKQLLLPYPRSRTEPQTTDHDHRLDFCSSANSVETNTEHLEALVWNPFNLETVSGNVIKGIARLNSQHNCPVNGSTVTENHSSEKVLKEFKSDTDVEIAIAEKVLTSIRKSPCRKGVSQSVISLPTVPLIKNSYGLNDTVTKFMMLRKKTIPSDKDSVNPSINVIVSESKTQVITEKIECEVDELTMKFVKRIYDYCKPELKNLVSKSIIKEEYAFMRIEETSLEFTLKEHIKCNDKFLCGSLLRLIPLKKALTIAIQLDTEASLDYLKSLPNKDSRFLICIQDLSQVQFEIVFSGHKTSKMMKLCNILAQESGMCLILISNARHSKSFLCETITKISGIPIAPTISFPDFNCYFYNTEDITSEFPWNRFKTIIEFNQSHKEIENLIAETNAKHYVLNTVLPPQDNISCKNIEEFKVIAYSSLDFKVLQCLENEHNFVVYQRQATDQYSHETLIIDEKTCIVIIKNLNEVKQVRLLSALFIKISLRYSVMSIIFDVSTCHYTELFSVVFASIAHFQPNVLKINAYYCLTVNDMCKRIVKIAHDAKDNISLQWKSTELWLKRTWLTEEESNHEKILSKIPCINSYTAQIMLTTYFLVDLMGLSLQECIENIPVVPVEVLIEFHKTVHIVHQPDHNKTVQFDTQPSVQEYTPTQVESPRVSYQRTSLPPLNTLYDMGDALTETYQTPKRNPVDRYKNLIKTPMKPQNIVKPFLSRENFSENISQQRAAEEKHKSSFSYSKRRKVMIDRKNVTNDGQATLFIEK